jgi:hypothetical protein
MFRAILRSASTNARRLLYIWLAVLVANQLFIFGACFAPYCLAAAVPHTLAIAVLVNFFGFGRDAADKKKLLVRSNLESSLTGGLAADSSGWKRPATHKSRAGPVILCALIAACVVLALVIKNASGSLEAPAARGLAAVDPIVYAPLEGEVPDERAPLIERQRNAEANEEIPDERASLAQRRGSKPSGSASSYATVRYENGDDEFDINDIEQYERVTKTKYRGTSDPAKQVQFVEDEAPGAENARHAPAFVTKQAAGADDSIGQRAKAHQPYRCVNSSGRVSDGIGRTSRDSEYSAFLGRTVHAGEFVIFQYAGSAKEYWFKNSNCQRL